MALLLDIFGFISVLLRGLTLTAQAFALGGIAFITLLAQPLAPHLAGPGIGIRQRSYRLLGWSALALAFVQGVFLTLQILILGDTTGLGLKDLAGADFVIAGGAVTFAALALAFFAFRAEYSFDIFFGLLLGAVILAGQAATSHAAEQIAYRYPLAAAELLHQLGGSVWIGGLPYFLVALGKCRDGQAWRLVGKRFSLMSMASVALLAGAGLYMAVLYIGSPDALYGTAYGIMVSTKTLLLAGLLLLGGLNFLHVERLRRDPGTPILRLRRFAEAEIGIGLTVLFAAASLTSQPPGIDLVQDRASLGEVVERLTPHWPRLETPDHSSLAIPELQARLDAEAAQKTAHAQAFTPGAGQFPPRNAEDVAWSEYNHHWAGIFVLVIGLLAVAQRAGVSPARHWPLLFMVLGAFLLVRSDPETWPLGDIGFFESLRDPEVVQHRLLVLLTLGFALFEWRVYNGGYRTTWPPLVFPVVMALGGALLLTHSHALSNLKEQLLIEVTHVPLALLAIIAGWSRWLELRLAPAGGGALSWIWRICLVLVGLVLLTYREA